jgi:hypothetical protein
MWLVKKIQELRKSFSEMSRQEKLRALLLGRGFIPIFLLLFVLCYLMLYELFR